MSDWKKTPQTGYAGPGFPTTRERGSSKVKLALLTAGTAAAAGTAYVWSQVAMAGGMRSPREPKPNCGTTSKSWLSNLLSPEPPPRLMGEMVMPEHRPPVREPFPEAAGGIAEPAHQPEDQPEQGAGTPGHEPPPGPLPPELGALVGPDPGNPGLPAGTPDAASTGLRSVYLQGSTAAGKAFTACVRIDQGDEASYQAIMDSRREILALLAPLAEDPALAKTHTAFGLVSQVVKGARIRQAGVLR